MKKRNLTPETKGYDRPSSRSRYDAPASLITQQRDPARKLEAQIFVVIHGDRNSS
jgi:hypothetical protein